jgi:hypothetical protein
MAQLFKPSANSAARASLLLLAALPLIGFYSGSTISRSSANTKVNVPLNQPVPFSHMHHAYELGISCYYCHTSVEKSPTASLPPSETCMSCHSQIWTNSPLLEPVRKSYETDTPVAWNTQEQGWNQVAKVPEFVFFNHSIHIDRGINCNQCHGPIQKMNITWKGQQFSMAWCLECHREPEKYLYADPRFPDLTPQQQAMLPYWLFQNGMALTPQQKQMIDGETGPLRNYDKAEGEALLKKYGVLKDQLTDCWICHR